MNRPSCIYKRVSSEAQAEKASPAEQEADCLTLLKANGDILVDIYSDTQKYRVGNRWVEPSGARSDRPELRRMIADVRSGRIQIIYAWCQDRLWRNYRSMVDVLDLLTECPKADIILATENFDRTYAPIMTMIAHEELKKKHNRLMMGVAGRYRQGKDWNSSPLYGLSRLDGLYFENLAEANVVRLIWQWYGQGDTVQSIHDRLVDMGVPQRHADARPWTISRLYQMLKKASYYTGILERQWAGELFILQIPVIVPPEIAQPVLDRLARYKANPAGNLKALALVPGLVYCQSCGCKMSLISTPNRKKVYYYYRCNSYLTNGTRSVGCCRQVRMERLDSQVWEKIQRLADSPAELDEAIEAEIVVLQAGQGNVQEDLAGIDARLETLATERQMVVTWARKKTITEADLETQLAALSWQEAALQGERTKLNAATVGDQIAELQKVSENFRQMVEIGRELESRLTDEQVSTIIESRRIIVQGIVKCVTVNESKTPLVALSFGILDHLHGSVLTVNWPVKLELVL